MMTLYGYIPSFVQYDSVSDKGITDESFKLFDEKVINLLSEKGISIFKKKLRHFLESGNKIK